MTPSPAAKRCSVTQSSGVVGVYRATDLSLDILCCILHEDSAVRVTLAHLLLPLFQTHQHVVRDDHWLKPHFLRSRIFP